MWMGRPLGSFLMRGWSLCWYLVLVSSCGLLAWAEAGSLLCIEVVVHAAARLRFSTVVGIHTHCKSVSPHGQLDDNYDMIVVVKVGARAWPSRVIIGSSSLPAGR